MNGFRLRASALTFTDAPDLVSGRGFRFFEDAVISVVGQRIEHVDSWSQWCAGGGDTEGVEHLPEALVLPGFIDAHIHAPQINMIASYGRQLLDWLTQFTFPEEARFADPRYAEAAVDRFFGALLAAGTTSAMVFGTVHAHTADLLFSGAQRRGMSLIAGKVMTDRNVPPALTESLSESIGLTRDLIARWHGQSRLRYALTPRFAITSTPDHLNATGNLLRETPDLYLQTHLAENLSEVEATKRLYPERRDYVDVYAQAGLCSPRSIFAHGIHLGARELDALAETGSAIAFCPTSNLFLGSGLLDISRLRRHGVGLAVATDVGAGTSFSMLRTLAEGYKVSQLLGQSWHPLEAFHAITLGNARVLGLGHEVGALLPGYFADLVVLRAHSSPDVQGRFSASRDLADRLFALLMLGDERNVVRTYVGGQLLHRRED
ncbi:MAG: guanine deaminase [Pseudomonadales bacterium]